MATKSEQALWIWYPGDYEIWLGNRMNNRRTERGAFFPPFWKADSHYVTVEFSKTVDLAADEEIRIAAEGTFNLKLDGKLQFGMPDRFLLPAGHHQLCIKIWNQAAPPALYVAGATLRTDDTWRVTCEDKEWIDESGKASDTSATLYLQAGSWCFDDPASPPSRFALPREAQRAAAVREAAGGRLYDFGRETFGYAVLEGLAGTGEVAVYYGESVEEATDTERCETLDRIRVGETAILDRATNRTEPRAERYVLGGSKAFRYLYVVCEGGVGLADVSMEYEYAPVAYRGSFRSNDEELNRIWEVGAYTMHLTTREFFIDGIKRDRWVWSGDAVQSYLMNYYLFFDSACVRRTTWLLRGKDPVTSHTNTIMDYTFYWFIGIYDYYRYTGDEAFVRQIYPRMRSMMDYVLGRTNADGMVEGMEGDWVFVDWADGYLDKRGELAIEQVLFCRSLEAMALCAGLAGEEADRAKFGGLAAALRAKLLPAFWDEERQALVHNRVNGVRSGTVTRYANMFASFFGYLTPEQQQRIKHSVLLNDEILGITTPYMRFYELEALCALGEQRAVLREMKAYWGGMLREGATSFWEKYNPGERGAQHLAMYGRPYGKSLCHAWGASPIYLLGKYYLGVNPTAPGYAAYEVRPVLGGLEWMEGTVPTPRGAIRLRVEPTAIRIEASEGEGTLYVASSVVPTVEGAPEGAAAERLADGTFRIPVAPNRPLTIRYAAVES